MPLDASSLNDGINPVVDPRTGIVINPERDQLIDPFAKTMLDGFYLRKGETIQEGFARPSKAWNGGDDALAQRLYDASSQQYFGFSSPVFSNAPLKGENLTSLAGSCFLSYVPDTIQGLMEHTDEAMRYSILGGGIGAGWSPIRSASEKSPGPISFLPVIDKVMEAYKQGKTRKGSYAAYIDVSHPDILEFIKIRIATGDQSRKCHSTGFHNAVNITDEFMNAIIKNKIWNLIDPHDKTIRDSMPARQLWQEILTVRYRTGEPYLFFIDEANRQLPESQKNLGLRIHNSNLCLVGETKLMIQINDEIEEIKLEDFVERFSFGFYGKGVKIKSYDENTEQTIWQEVLDAAQTGETDELIRIEFDEHVVECTPEHKILTKNRGWIEAMNLNENDELIASI